MLREFVEWTQTLSDIKKEDTPTFADFEQELENLHLKRVEAFIWHILKINSQVVAHCLK